MASPGFEPETFSHLGQRHKIAAVVGGTPFSEILSSLQWPDPSSSSTSKTLLVIPSMVNLEVLSGGLFITWNVEQYLLAEVKTLS
ncbi:hypothetical protein GBA52_015844 [Prunus armeniaca]|nr:hypothetical protein GBA52_015844 [Prunus armeniaca]